STTTASGTLAALSCRSPSGDVSKAQSDAAILAAMIAGERFADTIATTSALVSFGAGDEGGFTAAAALAASTRFLNCSCVIASTPPFTLRTYTWSGLVSVLSSHVYGGWGEGRFTTMDIRVGSASHRPGYADASVPVPAGNGSGQFVAKSNAVV